MKKYLLLGLLASCVHADPGIVFFNGKPPALTGGYTYSYPFNASMKIDKDVKHEGKNTLLCRLDGNTWSGAAIGKAPTKDLSEMRENGKLSFSIKGTGNEITIALVDGDKEDGAKVESRVALIDFVSLSKEWQAVRIPLSKFLDLGKFWDGNSELVMPFAWDDVQEVKFSVGPSSKGQNLIHLADIRIEE